MNLIATFFCASSIVLLYLWIREARRRGRANTLRELLDGADQLERQLAECSNRMHAIKDMLDELPKELSERASRALDADDKVQVALRDLLAHRLWIKQNAQYAQQTQLQEACIAMRNSNATLDGQLQNLIAISNDLAKAGNLASTPIQSANLSLKQ